MADIVDLEDEPQTLAQPSAEELKAALESHLAGRDLSALSLKGLRRELEQRLGFPEGGLDCRKEEIKTFAGAFAQAQLSAPKPAVQSPPKTEAPAKRRRTMLAGVGTVAAEPSKVLGGATAGTTPPTPAATEAAGPKAKKKAVITAYSLWSNDNRARLTQELSASKGGEKPSFGEVCKAISEGWKQVTEQDRASYEAKAAQARADAAAAGPQDVPASTAKVAKPPKEPKAGKGGGKGKGKGKDPNASVNLNRADFLRAAQAFCCSLRVGDGTSSQDEAPLSTFVCKPRLFKSGGAGWYQFADIDLPIGEQKLRIKAQLNILVPSSKYWEDGEGLAEALAGAGCAVIEGEVTTTEVAVASVDAEAEAPAADAETTEAVSAAES